GLISGQDGSVVKPVPQLCRNLPGTAKMRAAKGVAQVNEITLIGQICSCEFDRPVLSERLPYRQVYGTVTGQVLRPIAIHESGTVSEVSGEPGPPGHTRTETGAESMPLVVIQEEKSISGWTEIGEPAGHASCSFYGLMRVSQM